MSLKVILLIAVPMFIICCAILFKYRDRFKKPPKQRGHRKIEKVPETVLTIEKVPETVLTICLDEIPDNQNEAEEKMAKPIFISADCWLCVFNLLPPRQLGFGIAMISHRFNIYVDEHFKTRKWTLKRIRIQSQNGENGTKQMEIVTYDGDELPIPQIQMPRKVIGFKLISISFINRNAIAFLRRFRQLFATFCPNNLSIYMDNDRIMEFFLRNIWPMLNKNIYGFGLSSATFRHLRHFVPSILNDFPSIRVVSSYFEDFFVEFPCDDNANASNGQSVAKWLFTPRPDNVPKLFTCVFNGHSWDWPLKIAALKAAFTDASSPANFIVIIRFLPPSFGFSVVPFALTNELTREQLALKRTDNYYCFLFIRCPIARDESKWTKWEEEAIGWRIYDQWNLIYIAIFGEDEIGDGLIDEISGPSDQTDEVNE